MLRNTGIIARCLGNLTAPGRHARFRKPLQMTLVGNERRSGAPGPYARSPTSFYKRPTRRNSPTLDLTQSSSLDCVEKQDSNVEIVASPLARGSVVEIPRDPRTDSSCGQAPTIECLEEGIRQIDAFGITLWIHFQLPNFTTEV